MHRHAPHPTLPRRVPSLGVWATLALAAVLFAGIYLLRASDANPVDSEDVLLTVPLAVLALKFGVKGGLVGALLGLALIGCWDIQDRDAGIEVEGYLSWGASFALLGGLLGFFVEHRRKLEREITRYFDESLDMLGTADLNGQFTRVNPAWERVLGHSAETICSRPYIDFVHPEDREATIAEAAVLSRSPHSTLNFRNRYRTATGDYRLLEWTAHSSPSAGAIHAVARDITVQHKAEEQLANYAETLEAKVAERTRELEDARAKTLRRLAMAAEYRDDDTFEHTERVGAVSAEIAARLGLERKQIETLRLAAPLHDVGKIGIPDRILLKPGRLTPEECEAMKRHTALGARLLSGSGSPVLQMGTLIAESHHERWDGRGYPWGRAGEDVPLVARIVAVADVFDALTHERPYKSAWPIEQAIAEIERGAGSQFDPSVVQAFLATRSDAAAPLTETPHRKAAANGASPGPLLISTEA